MERTMSMSSYGIKTDLSKTSRSVMGAATVTSSDKAKEEREISAIRRQLQQYRQQDDVGSDTSSQRERKFANLLGASDTESSAPDMLTSARSQRNVGCRLYQTGCGREASKQSRLQAERDRLLMQEMAQMTQRPNITARARSKPSKGLHFAEHASLWNSHREMHLNEIAKKLAAEKLAEIQPGPKIDPKSQLIVESSGEYRGPVKHWNAHFDKYASKKVATIPSPYPFTPNINDNSARVTANRDIASRLYEEAAVRRQRLLEKTIEVQARQLVDPATGRNFFSPHFLRLTPADERRRPEEISALLFQEAQAASERRQRARSEHPDNQISFTPTINPTSASLAAGKRKPLYTPPQQGSKPRSRSAERAGGSELNARPMERQSSVTSNGVDEFLRRTEHKSLIRAQRLQAIRDEQSARESSECTFKPYISRRSEEIFNASSSSAAGGDIPSPLPVTPHESVGTAVSPVPKSAATPPSAATRSRQVTREFAALMAASGLSAGLGPKNTTEEAPRPVRRTPDPSGQATPRGGAAAATEDTGGELGNVEHYIAAFESQMYSVLEEWRKLEEA